MSHAEFILNNTVLWARPSGVLWWPEAQTLCVSDLHLGKAERFARLGRALLPPYETVETLKRLEAEITALQPKTIICLGDSFDDVACVDGLDTTELQVLTNLMAGRRWIWVEGNHDPGDSGLNGSHVEELQRGPLHFRHIAQMRSPIGEVTGHFHPKVKIATRAGRLSQGCFLYDKRRLILPAFGTYTGGLDVRDPALKKLFPIGATCILTGKTAHKIPLPAPVGA